MNTTIIKEIKLSNFRCHESYHLDCKPSTTLILGQNGCGKTSVLEAIYIAMQGKSFRAVDREIIRRDTDFYRVEINLQSGEKIVVAYEQDGNKQFIIKDKKTTRLPKAAKYPLILFLPEDLHLIATSPTRRREYFDRVITQLVDGYSTALSRYNKAMKQRNELLKQDYVTIDSVFSWDVILAKYGIEIRNLRAQIIAEINAKLTKTYQTIAKNQDQVELNYESYIGDIDESKYLRILQLDFERDAMTGHTNFGIHKDDYKFIFNNSLADGNASRGEVRSIILALKFIEAELIFDKLGKKPIVLLDDVFSELDSTRQKSLTKNFSHHQVILTSVKGV